jgi:endonuclease III
MIENALQSAIKIIREKLEEPIASKSDGSDKAAYVFGVAAVLLQQIGEEHPAYRREFQELGMLLENIY